MKHNPPAPRVFRYPLREIAGATAMVMLAVLAVAPRGVSAAGQPALAAAIDESQLCRGDYLSEDAARHQLEDFARTFATREEWQARAGRVREGILHGAKLLPPPPRTPLKPVLRPARRHPGYTVENVAFESLPGFYVTGNLYRPEGTGKEPRPAVLVPHGHFFSPNGGGRFHPDVQVFCATLARMGAVVFTYDMVGWGEATQVTHDHPFALGLQLWDSIRALDLLLSLPGVDPARVAVAGASGGGTQAFLLNAVDDRPACSAPVVIVSANYFGGCSCENGMPIHRGPKHTTDNADIAALAAPRPQLLVSCGGDFTRNTPAAEYPYLQRVYRLFGAEARVENRHLADEDHDFGPSKRAAVYGFLAKQLHLDFPAVADLGRYGGVDESGSVVEPRELLLVFDAAHQRPAQALQGNEAVAAAFLRR